MAIDGSTPPRVEQLDSGRVKTWKEREQPREGEFFVTNEAVEDYGATRGDLCCIRLKTA
jgi:hypothetical protein